MPEHVVQPPSDPQPGKDDSLRSELELSQDFNSLDELFSTEWAAECLIRSDDESLSKANPPATIASMREGGLIWKTIHKPSTNQSQISARQNVLKHLLEADNFAAVKELKDRAYGLADGINMLFAVIKVDDFGTKREALDVYRSFLKNPKTPGGQHAAQIVRRGFALMEDGQKALLELAQDLISKEGKLAKIGEELLELSCSAEHLTREYFLETFNMGRDSRIVASEVESQLIKAGSLIEFANLALKEELGSCGYDQSKNPEYSDGWSIVCPETKENPNASPEHSSITVYSGSNMSGKSESGLKQNFYIQLLAQSFGYTTANSGNFDIYDSFFYVDRASSDHARDLSAYGKEVKTHIEVINKLGKKAFGCLDEPYSTTSPEGQKRMLIGHTSYLAEQGARIFVATHNDPFIKASQSDPNSRTYHFKTEVSEEGEAVYHYELTEGIGDSNSIRVARGLKVNPELLSGAVNYMEGTVTSSLESASVEWPVLEAYSKAERAELKKGKDGAGLLLSKPSNSEGLFFHPFSNDEQLTERTLPLYVKEELPEYCKVGGWSYLAGGESSLITDMILRSEAPSPQELLERQKTFAELVANDKYAELAKLELDIRIATKFLGFLEFPGFLLDFTRHLSPISDDHNQELGPKGEEALLYYLRLNQKLLGESFLHNDIKDRYEDYFQLNAEIEDFCQNQTFEDLAKSVDEVLDRELPSEVHSAFSELVERARSAGHAFQGSATFRSAQRLRDLINAEGEKISSYSERWEEGGAYRILSSCVNLNAPKEFNLEKITTQLLKIQELFPEEEIELKTVSRKRIEELLELFRTEVTIEQFIADGRVKNKDQIDFLNKLKNSLLYAQSIVPISDPFRRGRLEKMFEVWRVGDDSSIPNLGNLDRNSKEFIKKIADRIHLLPAVCAYDVDLEEVREELEALGKYFKDRLRGSDCNYNNRWPDSLKVVLTLEIAMQNRNVYQDFLDILRGYDSIYMHQIANAVEGILEQFGTPVSSGFGSRYIGRDHEEYKDAAWRRNKKHLAQLVDKDRITKVKIAVDKKDFEPFKNLLTELRIVDPRKPFDNVRTVYQQDIDTITSGLLKLDREYAALYREYPWIDSNHDGSMERVRALFEESEGLGGDQLFYRYTAYDQYADPSERRLNIPKSLSWKEKDRLKPVLKEFYDNVIRKSELVRRVEESLEARFEINRRIAEYCKSHDMLAYRDLSSPYVLKGAWEALKTLMSQKVEKVVQSPNTYLTESFLKDLEKQMKGALSLAGLGSYYRKKKCAQVHYNHEGIVHFEDLFSVFGPEGQVKHSLMIDEEGRFWLLNGPNMSGKTLLKKEVVVALCMALTTGFTTASFANIPLFAGVLYFDRVTGKLDNTLSAAGNELKLVNKALDILGNKQPMFIAIDEIFSTMSPHYQAAFTDALVRLIHSQGHYVILSTHHHEQIEQLDRLSDEIKVKFLKYEIDENGEIVYYYEIRPGRAPSEEIAVARKLGMPEEVLIRAEAA